MDNPKLSEALKDVVIENCTGGTFTTSQTEKLLIKGQRREGELKKSRNVERAKLGLSKVDKPTWFCPEDA